MWRVKKYEFNWGNKIALCYALLFQSNFDLEGITSWDEKPDNLTQRNCWRWWYNQNVNTIDSRIECLLLPQGICIEVAAKLEVPGKQGRVMKVTRPLQRQAMRVMREISEITLLRQWEARIGRRRGSWPQRRRTSARTSLKQTDVSSTNISFGWKHRTDCYKANEGMQNEEKTWRQTFPESSMLVSCELPWGEVGHHGAHVLHRGREHGRLGVRQAGAGQVVLRLRLVLLHLLHLGEKVARLLAALLLRRWRGG